MTEVPIPERVPLMIFPGALLFPHNLTPLYIFEPRYRAMLDWALQQERMFCLVLPRPGVNDAKEPEDYFDVAGLGLIRACVKRDDGTSHLMLQGVVRVRITDCEQETPFRIARIEPIMDEGHTNAEVKELAEDVRELCTSLISKIGEVPPHLDAQLRRFHDAGILADTVAGAFVRDPYNRQSLLEEPNVAVRLSKLRALLRSEIL